ncbi:hypothetical protein B0H34DRAFT_332832 [Crassisporium funariophilum]|nr:hypothetical protein B0H34DRAFT_332832 [Crassisporium funariophilum]
MPVLRPYLLSLSHDEGLLSLFLFVPGDYSSPISESFVVPLQDNQRMHARSRLLRPLLNLLTKTVHLSDVFACLYRLPTGPSPPQHANQVKNTNTPMPLLQHSIYLLQRKHVLGN